MTRIFSLPRRRIFKAAALGAAALAAPQIMTRAALAQEAGTSDGATGDASGLDFHHFAAGDFSVTTLNDGGRVMDDPHTIFGTDQPQEEVAALLEQNYLPTEQAFNTFTPTLIDTGSELILFDTGNGEAGRQGGTGRMMAALEAAGHSADDVSIIVLTHLHGDHINGLMESGAPAFANARYMTGQVEYDYWTDEARVGTPAERGHMAVMEKVVPLADNMTFLADGDAVVSGVTAMEAFGHTPGHMIFMVESGDRQLVLTADTANHFVLSLQRPDWAVSFDTDTQMAAETRKRVFDMIAADRLAFIGYHMPFPALGYVEKQDTGYRYIAETYQFEV